MCWRALATSLAIGAAAPAWAQAAASDQSAPPPAAPASTAPAVSAPAAAPAPAAPASHFEIRAFQVKGNVTASGPLLAADRVERVVYPYMGPDKSEADVEAARAALQKAYEEAGYPAVSVFVPEQTVGTGVLVLQVQPQTIGKVAVEGTKRPESVTAQTPSLTPGETPNLKAFQRDVIALNQKPSRKVTPELRAGEAPGTLDVVLKVQDSSPFHGSAELNNYASASTTNLRAAASLRYDDLWGRGDSISISAQTAPRRTSDAKVFSGNYLMHLATGLQFLLYGVHSDSDIAVVGGTSVIGKGDMAGARVIASLGAAEGFYHSLTLGMDWKHFKEDVLLGADRASVPITYYPVTAAWRGDWTGDRKDTDLTLSTVFGIRGLGDGQAAFDAKRYQARPSFVIVKVDGSHTRDVFGHLQIYGHLTGQWAGAPLISNEQFSLGGMQSVRGYYESEALGDWGVALQTELRSPDIGGLIGPFVKEWRVYAFADGGVAGIYDPLPAQKDFFRAVSVGAGGRLKLFNHLTGTLDAGVPVLSAADSKSGDVFIRFRILGEF